MIKKTVGLLSVLCALLIPGMALGEELAAISEYRLASGDRVKVTVFGHEDLSGEFDVNGAGEVSLPLIREVMAQGHTVSELEERIIDALKPDYLIHPSVSVEVLNYRPFYIIGEVTAPGSYAYVNGMTVLNAVAVSGGFTYRAKKNQVVIQRTNGDDTEEIRADPSSLVLPGDVIEVPERFF